MEREEAIKIIRDARCTSPLRDALEFLIPELRESEDERIRKAVLKGIEYLEMDEGWDSIGDIDILDAKQWLEKQKEKNLFEEAMEKMRAISQQVLDEYELEKQKEQKPEEPNWIHHKVDLSDCSEEYIKAYYDGWNNCNQQHAQYEAEQKPAEWNANDKAFIKDCARILDENGYAASAERLLSMFPIRPAEWSEEDEDYLADVLWCIEQAEKTAKSENDMGTCWCARRFLKSLRPSWKPSEEQMEALKCAIEDIAKFSKRGGRQVEFENEPYYMALHSLYEQLKSL